MLDTLYNYRNICILFQNKHILYYLIIFYIVKSNIYELGTYINMDTGNISIRLIFNKILRLLIELQNIFLNICLKFV